MTNEKKQKKQTEDAAATGDVVVVDETPKSSKKPKSDKKKKKPKSNKKPNSEKKSKSNKDVEGNVHAVVKTGDNYDDVEKELDSSRERLIERLLNRLQVAEEQLAELKDAKQQLAELKDDNQVLKDSVKNMESSLSSNNSTGLFKRRVSSHGTIKSSRTTTGNVVASPSSAPDKFTLDEDTFSFFMFATYPFEGSSCCASFCSCGKSTGSGSWWWWCGNHPNDNGNDSSSPSVGKQDIVEIDDLEALSLTSEKSSSSRSPNTAPESKVVSQSTLVTSTATATTRTATTKSSTWCWPFMFALIILLTQWFIYIALHVGIGDLWLDQVPMGVTSVIRATQIVALMISLFTQQDLLSAAKLYVLSSRPFKPVVPSWKYRTSVFLRLLTGFMGLYTTFMLIAQARSVFELLLNFTAMEFVAQLDDIMFYIAKGGYFGPTLEDEAELIATTFFNEPKQNQSSSQSKGLCGIRLGRRMKRFLWILVPFVIAFVGLAFAQSQLISKQRTRDFEHNVVYVQFTDEADPSLIALSGVYRGVIVRNWNGKKGGAIKYVPVKVPDDDESQVMASHGFVYCRERDSPHWRFDRDGSRHPCDDTIDVWSNKNEADFLKSDEFDLTTSVNNEWIYTNQQGSPFQFNIVAEEAKIWEKYRHWVNASTCNQVEVSLYVPEGTVVPEGTLTSALFSTQLLDRQGAGTDLVAQSPDSLPLGQYELHTLADRPFFRGELTADLWTYLVFVGYYWMLIYRYDTVYNSVDEIKSKNYPNNAGLTGDFFSGAMPFLSTEYYPTIDTKWYEDSKYGPALGSEAEFRQVSCVPDCPVGHSRLRLDYFTEADSSKQYIILVTGSNWNFDSLFIASTKSSTFTMPSDLSSAFMWYNFETTNTLETIQGCIPSNDIVTISFIPTAFFTQRFNVYYEERNPFMNVAKDGQLVNRLPKFDAVDAAEIQDVLDSNPEIDTEQELYIELFDRNNFGNRMLLPMDLPAIPLNASQSNRPQFEDYTLVEYNALTAEFLKFVNATTLDQ